METSGLCHTDIHAAQGDWPVKPSPPFVPGHEGIAIVQAAGDHVTRLRVGDRVAIPWLGEACGHCDHGVSGWETLCLQAAEQRLIRRREPHRVRTGARQLCGARSRRDRPARSGAPDLRGRHHLRGGQAVRRTPGHPRPRLRHRRASATSPCSTRGSSGRRPSPSTTWRSQAWWTAPATPHDRRRVTVTPTPAGRSVLAEIQSDTRNVQEELLAPLTEDERTQLEDLLRRVYVHRNHEEDGQRPSR